MGYVDRLGAFVSAFDVEIHFLAFGQSPETVHLNSREMYEYIFTARPLNKAVTFSVVKPLHLASCSHRIRPHFLSILLRATRRAAWSGQR